MAIDEKNCSFWKTQKRIWRITTVGAIDESPEANASYHDTDLQREISQDKAKRPSQCFNAVLRNLSKQNQKAG